MGAIAALITGDFVPTAATGRGGTAGGDPGFITGYVPKGSWSEFTTGIDIVPIDGSGGAGKMTVSTPHVVNSCSANQVTHKVVCVANETDIYIINGDTGALETTLTSGATSTAGFSGGTCHTCGVVVDSVNNRAVISLGLAASSGYQLLNLSDNTLSTPFDVSGNQIAEHFGLDPSKPFILSPAYGTPDYQLFDISTPGSPKQFNFSHSGTVLKGALLDSAGIDTSTKIVLSTDEFTGNIFIADLSQATFTSGSPTGTWDAPSQLQDLSPDMDFPAAGTTALAVASGAHQALLEDEFGTTAFGAILLPSTSGSGTPAVQDWVRAEMPKTPDSAGWIMPLDPHGLTAAFVHSSTDAKNKGFGLLMNDQRTFVAVIDLTKLLAQPRTAGTHKVVPGTDLTIDHTVRFVSIH